MKPLMFVALVLLLAATHPRSTSAVVYAQERDSDCPRESDDLKAFIAFVRSHYGRPSGAGLAGLILDFPDRTGVTAKVFGHALSRQLNYLRRGTPQQQRWNTLERETETSLLCLATVDWNKKRNADMNQRATYLANLKRIYQSALLGAYDDEVAAAAGVRVDSVPSFFGSNEDASNKAISPSEEETALLGWWFNESMKFGNTDVELLPAENFVLLQADRTYQYQAHTKGANLVHTKGMWRYYRNGAKRYVALQHTHLKKAGAFEALPKPRESIFEIRTLSTQQLVLFEAKDDPSWSVTLVYSKR